MGRGCSRGGDEEESDRYEEASNRVVHGLGFPIADSCFRMSLRECEGGRRAIRGSRGRRKNVHNEFVCEFVMVVQTGRRVTGLGAFGRKR
jgi:hypothetical protein